MNKDLRHLFTISYITKKKVLLLTTLFCFNICQATDWFVNDNSLTGDVFTTAIGNNANPGTASAPFATIQFAINSASAGDIIYVDAGTYVSGDIHVTKTLTIRGVKFGIPAGPAAVPANRGTNESIIEGSIYFNAATDNITIDGFTIDMGFASRGIEARGLNTIIINNIVTGILNPFVLQQGISTRANAPVRVHSYTISYNNVRNVRFGIFMDGTVENPSEISYNYVTNCPSGGYLFTASNGHHIKANVSENNNQGMIFTEGNNLIEQNTITGNDTVGIRLVANPLLSGNYIINNFITNNGIGIGLDGDDPAAINNEAHYNSITGNILHIASEHSNNFNAKCNWYGTTDLTTIDAGIIGNVTYIPYLTDGIDSDPVLDGFQPVTTCSVIPVILTTFNASVNNYDVKLSWQTASEINSSHFIIQRSFNNHQYENIGNVNARGFSDIISNYSFIDDNPANFDRPTFYRMAMVDLDGSLKYSKVISIVLKSKGFYVHPVYPNPVHSGTTLHTRFISPVNQVIAISIISATGYVISQFEKHATKGVNVVGLDIAPGIPPGNYFLVFRASGYKKISSIHVY